MTIELLHESTIKLHDNLLIFKLSDNLLREHESFKVCAQGKQQHCQLDVQNSTLFTYFGDECLCGKPIKVQIYADKPQKKEVLIKCEELMCHGAPSIKISTLNAQYVYDLTGGAFSEIRDISGNDWVQYDNIGAPICYRGVPNMQTYGANGEYAGIFHPGYGTVHSIVEEKGDIYIRIRSKTSYRLSTGGKRFYRGDWECVWEIYPHFAKCTVLKCEKTGFAFLYEGVPGGKKFDENTQYCMNANEEKHYFKKKKINTNCKEKWVYFGCDNSENALFFNYDEAESEFEKTFQVFDELAVFGFAREALPGITSLPATFSLGFISSNNYSDVKKHINRLKNIDVIDV